MVIGLIIGGGAAAAGVTAGTAIAIGVGAGAVGVATGAEKKVQNFIVDEIINPVVDGIGDVINYVLDNPIEAIAKVAAIATGQFWAVPLIDGAVVLANGGDLGDAVKAAAISYVAQGAGNVASTYTSAALKQAGVSATVANIVSAGTKSATTALVYGQDPLKAFAVGGLQAGVAAGLGEISNKMEEQFGSRFEDLRGGVKDSIFAGVAAELEGGNLSETQMGRIIGKYTGVAGLMEDFLEKNAGFSEAQASLITNALSSAVSTALAGNPDLSGEAFFKTISDAGAAELKKIIDRPVNDAIDKVSGAYTNVESSATALNNAIDKANTASESYNGLQARLNARIQEQDRLKTAYDNALATFNGNKTQANADAVNAAAAAFNAYATQLEADYNDDFKDQLAYWEGEFNKYNDAIPDLEAAYQDDLDWMVTKTEDLDTALAPSMDAAERAVTLTLRPNFDEDAYRKAAGLGANEDVYSHFLSQGQNLPTDAVSVDQTLNSARGQIIKSALANQGVDLYSLEPEQQQAVAAYVVNNVRSLTDITGMDFDNLASGALKAANDATPAGAAYPQSYGRASGVTDTDIVTGAAELALNGDTWEWQKTSTILNNLGDTNVNISQNNNGTLSADIVNRLSAGEAVEVSPGVTMRWTGNTSSVGDNSDTLQGIVQRGLDGAAQMSTAVVKQIVDLNEEAGRLLDEYVGEPIWKATSDLYNTYVKDTTTGNALENTASVVVGATGELLQAASGLALLAGANPDNAVGRLAKSLLETGENLRTEGYQAAVDTINDTIGDATGWREKAMAIWSVATDSETRGVFFAEYVGKELLQEIPILLASGGAGNVAKRALQSAGEQVAKRYAARVGVSTAIGLDMAEAFGGTAAGAYDEAYATALNVGMSQEEANQYAIEVGQKAGAIATLMVGVTAGVGGAAFEKAILGEGAQDAAMRSMYDAFKDRLIEGGKITIKEGVTEGIEEALPQAYVAMSLAQIDPTYDVSGEIAAAAILGKIAGAGTAAGIYTGDAVADALFSSSTEVQNAIQNAGSSEAATQALQNLGINDNLVLNNLLNTSYDQYYVSTGEAGTAFEKANPDFQVDQSTIESFVGKTNESQLQNTVDQYIDTRYLDRDEVKAIAAAEGLTLTDEEADAYVQQGSTTQIANIEQALQQQYDAQYTTSDEVLNMLRDLDFNTYPFGGGWRNLGKNINWQQETAQQFEGMTEAEARDAVAAYVDPRQVTEAEAKKFFEDMGYTPTQEEINAYVGQSHTDANFEAGAPDRIEAYVDPRQVTDAEARQFFSDLGYTPTDAEVADFVAQVAETEQKTAIGEYVDPRFVTYDEVQAIADQEGLTLTEALAETYLGQKDEAATLEAARGAFDPLATTYSEAKQFFADLGYTPSYDEIAQFVASAMEEAQRGAVGEYVDPRQVTLEESRAFLEGLGYTPTDTEVERFVGQVNEAQQEVAIGEYVDPRLVTEDEVVAAYAELGLSRPTDEDIQRLMGQYMESELAGRAEEYLPTARYNSIINILDNFTGEVGVSQEMQDALNVVKADMINALGDLGLEVAAIDQATQRLEDAVGRVASGDAEASGLYAYIDDAVQSLTDAGLTQEEVQATLSEIVGSPATDNTEATGIYATIADMGTTIDNLNDLSTSDVEGIVSDALSGLNNLSTEDVQDVVANIVGSPATADTPATGLYATIGDLNNISEEDVTTIVSDALSGLENISEEDVQNVVNGIIGSPATADEAATGLYDYVDDGLSSVQKSVLDKVQEYEDAGIARDEALSSAINDVATDLGVTEENILARIGTAATEDAPATGIYAALESNTNAILDVLGTPATEDTAGTGLYGYIDTAIDAIGADLSSLIGTVGTPAVLDADGNVVEAATGIFAELADLEAAGLSRDEAIAQLSADLGVAVTDLTNEITSVEESLSGDIAGVSEDVGTLAGILGTPGRVDDPSTEEDESRDPTGLFNTIAQYETAGMERDQAIQEALGDLSTELGLTEKAILDELGLTEIALGEQIDASEAALTEEIGNVETALTTRIDELEAAGIERDEALSTALGELATDLGTTEANILAELGTTEEALLAEIGGVQATLEETAAATDQDLDFISNLIGKPARDVTQTDVDFVADLIAQQQVLDELSLEYQQYDVTGDGVLDINDQQLLEQAMAGEQVQFSPESAFVTDPTGVYGALYNTQQEIQQQMEQDQQAQMDAIMDMNTQINTQLQTNQRMRNVSDLRNMLMQQGDLYGQQVAVKTPDPMRINYLYDFSSIFANPQQASLFPSPYAKGGQVEDTTDKLLRIIGE